MQNKAGKLKILFVIDTFGTGGREKVVVALANGLSNLDYDVNVLCLCSDVVDMKKELCKKVNFYTLPFLYKELRGFSAFAFWAKGLKKYINFLHEIQPQVIHTHVFFQHFLFVTTGLKVSRFKAVHFHTIHMNGLFYVDKGFINKFRLSSEKLAVYLAKPYVIAISESVFELCKKHFDKNAAAIRCIHNGIDRSKFDFKLKTFVSKEAFGFNNDDILVTYVARMDEGKDHFTLLQAWKKITQLNSNAKLILAGDGELKNELLLFVRDEDLSSSVFFMGVIANVNELLAITDIGVFTSLYEGFGIAVIEKMFMKLPVITTSIPAMQQLIIDGENGFLFNTKDFTKLAELLILLINNEDKRLIMGEAAYQSVQQYSLENMIARHDDYYNYVIDKSV